jgi:hypothetical protein
VRLALNFDTTPHALTNGFLAKMLAHFWRLFRHFFLSSSIQLLFCCCCSAALLLPLLQLLSAALGMGKQVVIINPEFDPFFFYAGKRKIQNNLHPNQMKYINLSKKRQKHFFLLIYKLNSRYGFIVLCFCSATTRSPTNSR